MRLKSTVKNPRILFQMMIVKAPSRRTNISLNHMKMTYLNTIMGKTSSKNCMTIKVSQNSEGYKSTLKIESKSLKIKWILLHRLLNSQRQVNLNLSVIWSGDSLLDHVKALKRGHNNTFCNYLRQVTGPFATKAKHLNLELANLLPLHTLVLSSLRNRLDSTLLKLVEILNFHRITTKTSMSTP